ncbi:MAG: transcription termination/antitermination protein NusA [Armatimonadetes bacterium]|nr:transcription termination/antitermination protein NusA [Armatimonadota bacterium]
MNGELINALSQLKKERAIPTEVLLEAIEMALISAYKRHFSGHQNVAVTIDRKTGSVQVLAKKMVVSEVQDPQNEILLSTALTDFPDAREGEELELEVTPKDFGRIAAQTAKQVIVQKLKEAEREMVFQEYTSQQGDVITGLIHRQENRNLFINLGKAEAILPLSEQVPTEHFRPGQRIKGYVLEVKKTTRGPQIVISRTCPGFLKRLFELEVPEIAEGIVEIKSLAREAGYRSKIAVRSREKNIDPVGSCVGYKGSRVQAIVEELRGEKIDIVLWSENAAEFVSAALSPARSLKVTLNEEEKHAYAIVPDRQLSLAIGREGQNARLVAKLTGWKIDITSESLAKAKEGEKVGAEEREKVAKEGS